MSAPEGHTLYQGGDIDMPAVILDSNGDVVLDLCKVCGRGEADLVEPCAPRESDPPAFNLASILDRCIQTDPVGSRVTCNPAPTDTDEDWLLLVNADTFASMYDELAYFGVTQDGSCPFNESADILEADDSFASFKIGELNLIFTTDPEFYDRFMLATAVAKRLNLLEKADRIALFQAVLYGNPPS